MSASIRNLQRGVTRAFSQSCAALVSRTAPTSSSSNPIASTSSSASSVRSKQHDKRQQKKKDAVLRKAVEMYHLTPSFLPNPQQASVSTSARQSSASSNSWESALDNTIYSSILNTDSVSRRSPNLVPRGLTEFSREQSSRAASVPAFGNTEQSASSRAKDIHSFASDLTSTTFLTRREREAAAADLTSANRSKPAGGASSSSQQNGGGLEHFTDGDIARYQRRHNHSAGAGSSSGLDSGRYSGAERLTHLDRITPGGNEWYRSQGLDTRSARIRDAIFGTVNGELPGLEVVRERIAEMRRENAASRPSSSN
ncbi:hypothetical protein EX895_004186 [Sporisorium graminicola]|uniref:Uncharacterized protein n=1 Tax=Sporisorium graminicola TaxID=280036 RepID=A0A4U7KUA3_9BASI|nr:hypothetical protein EX895_004186 [Sporisorium graminicola]TKY86898.1 hypothetical protein EX895_004186 [Sporisorium graminicola]